MSNVDDILAERGKQHGKWTDNARMSQELKRVAHDGKTWIVMGNDQRESIDMILHKLGRVLSGNPNHVDHWDDIAGYATLIANRLRSERGQ